MESAPFFSQNGLREWGRFELVSSVRSRMRRRGNRHLCWQKCAQFANIRGETASARLWQAVASDELPAVGCGLGSFLGDAIALRSAAPMPTAFFRVRRASEVAALNLSEIGVDPSTGAGDIEVRRQKNGQLA